MAEGTCISNDVVFPASTTADANLMIDVMTSASTTSDHEEDPVQWRVPLWWVVVYWSPSWPWHSTFSLGLPVTGIVVSVPGWD